MNTDVEQFSETAVVQLKISSEIHRKHQSAFLSLCSKCLSGKSMTPILGVIDSTSCWKRSLEVLVHVVTTASPVTSMMRTPRSTSISKLLYWTEDLETVEIHAVMLFTSLKVRMLFSAGRDLVRC